MELKPALVSQNKPLLLAAATLAACLLPFCEYGGMSVSLVGIHGIIATVQPGLSELTDVGDGNVSVTGLTGSLNLLLLLYLVPVGAAAVIYFELTGKPGTRWVRVSGLASMALPVLVPLIAWELFKAWFPADVRSLTDSANAGAMGLTSGVGLWAIVLLGAVQTYLSFRRGAGRAGALTLSGGDRPAE